MRQVVNLIRVLSSLKQLLIWVATGLLITGCGEPDSQIRLNTAEDYLMRVISERLAAEWSRAAGKNPDPAWEAQLDGSKVHSDRCLAIPVAFMPHESSPDAWMIVINHHLPLSQKADVFSIWLCGRATDETSKQQNKAIFAVLGSKTPPFQIDVNGEVIAERSGPVQGTWSDVVRIHRIIRQVSGEPLMPGTFEDVRGRKE